MNFYLLIAGVLSLFLSVAHAVWGEKVIFTEIKKSSISGLSRTGLRVSWHQITSTLAVCGFGMLFTGLQLLTPSKVLIIFILVLMIANYFVFNLIALTTNKNIFKQTLPQTAIFLIMFVLVFLGIPA